MRPLPAVKLILSTIITLNISLFAIPLRDAAMSTSERKAKLRKEKTERLRGQWKALDGTQRSPTEVRVGEAIVRLKTGKHVPKRFGSQGKGISSEVAVLPWSDGDTAFSQFKARATLDPEIAAVEPNTKMRSEAVSSSGVSLSSRQVHQDKLNQVKQGLARWRTRAGREAPKRKKTRIAIFDSGIDDKHPALAGQVADGFNTFNVFPLESMDSLELMDTTTMDYQGHGTLVSGVIAAKELEGGMEGIDGDAVLYAVKVLNRDGIGTLANVLAGIEWAIAKKVDIINMSIGTSSDSPLLHDAIRKATGMGILIVAASGNQFAPVMAYPAAYPEVFSVGSVNKSGMVSAFSNFSEATSIYAPGEEVNSTIRSPSGSAAYHVFSGTSASAAYVTGYLGLLVSNGISSERAKSLIRKTAIERINPANPFDHSVKALNEDFVLGAIGEEDSVQVAIREFQIAPDYDRNSINVKIELANTSTHQSPGIPFSLGLSGDKGTMTVALGTLDGMAPGARSTIKAAIPFEDSLKSISSDGAYRLIRARLNGSGRLVEGMEKQDFFWVSDSAAESNDVEILALWESMATANAKEKPSGINIKIRNAGRKPVGNLNFGASIWAGLHEAVWSVPAVDSIGPKPVGTLQPGEVRVLSLPWVPADSLNKYTIQAELISEKGLKKRYLRSISKNREGIFVPEYAQVVHRDIVRQAVDLLNKQHIFIPDIGYSGSPYYDAPNYVNWGGIPASLPAANSPTGAYLTESSMHSMWGISNYSMVAGAHDCDGFDLLNGNSGLDTWNSHFWIVDDGDYGTGHSALDGTSTMGSLNKIQKIINGGGGGTGWLNHGAIEHYLNGYKSAAWYLLGHALHLIGDISLGSHVNDVNSHGVWGDVYHDWMDAGGYSSYTSQTAYAQGGLIDPYQSAAAGNPVRFLAYTTAQVGNSFPRFYTSPVAVINAGKSGNRNFGNSNPPHYDTYMNQVWAQMPKRPISTQDIASDEVWDWAPNWCFWCDAECQHVDWVGSTETRADCDNDGHKDFDNTDTPDGVPTDHDGDISAIAQVCYPYAIRAAAGLIYYFAVQTGQYTPPPVPTIIPPGSDPQLVSWPIIYGFGVTAGTESQTNLIGTGSPGTDMLIYGYHFNRTEATKNEVRFGGRLGTVKKFSEMCCHGADYGYLTVTIPNDALSGVVTVTLNNQTSTGSNYFQIPPRVTSTEPKTASPGDAVTFYGQNLENVTVSFTNTAASYANQVTATTLESDFSHIKVQVPIGKDVVNGAQLHWLDKWVATNSFLVKPVVEEILPVHGDVGQSFGIYGDLLHWGDVGTVTFAGNVKATLTSTSRYGLYGTIPAGAKSGPVVVSISTFNGTITSQADPVLFMFNPTVTGVSPASASPGASVVITGTNFIPDMSQDQVWIGNTQATVTAATETQLTATIPPGGQTDRVIVKIMGIYGYGTTFTYTPVLTAISPTFALPGRTMVLTGDYFISPASQNQVLFGTKPAKVISGTAQSLVVSIPPGSATVGVKVSVNGAASQSIPFKYKTLASILNLLLN
jgi:subtilisin